MKRFRALLIVLLLMFCCNIVFANTDDNTAPRIASFHINGYKKISMAPEPGKPAQSIIDIKLFDDISDRTGALSEISSNGVISNLSLDMYLNAIFDKSISVASFKMEGVAGPTYTKFGNAYNQAEADAGLTFTITINAGNAMKHELPQVTQTIPCNITVENVVCTYNGVSVTEGTPIKSPETAKIKPSAKGKAITVPKFQFAYSDNPNKKAGDIYSKTVKLNNFSAYHTDGKIYKDATGGFYKAGAKGAQIDTVTGKWSLEGIIKFGIVKSKSFNKTVFDTYPKGAYRVPVTFTVTVK